MRLTQDSGRHRESREQGIALIATALGLVAIIGIAGITVDLGRMYIVKGELQAKLPILATAMGHVSVASTAYYLALVEPIAEAASVRFAGHCRDFLDAVSGAGGDR